MKRSFLLKSWLNPRKSSPPKRRRSYPLELEQLEDRSCPSNIAPWAGNDAYSILHDQTLTVGSSTGLLANDDDMDSDPLSIIAINGSAYTPGQALTLPSGAGLTVNANGSFVYVPATHYTGQDSFGYTISDGVATASATVTITVTNNAPGVTAIANQNSIEGRSPTLQVNANDPDGDNITYAAAGLPPGLTINSTTGLISGKLSYTSAGSHNVTVTVTETVTDALGLSSQVMFVWAVADATIGTLKGTELNAGTALPNSVTVANIATTILDICPSNTVKIEVAAPAGGNLPLWTDTLFWIDGTGATPGTGDFSGAAWPEISISGAAAIYIAKAGIDLNGDSTLQGTEVTHLFLIRVVSFTSSTLASQRVGGGPLEPGLTSIKSAEHFEVGGTFKFEVVGGNTGSNGMISYELS